MKKLIAVMALASMFAVGCAHNKGGTSEGNYSTSDTSSDQKMQDKSSQNNNSSTSQPSSESNTNSNSSTSTPQQPQ